MSDLISRQAAIDAICNCTEVYVNNLPVLLDKREALEVIRKIVETEPERKKGKWIDIDSQQYTWKVRCNQCGAERSMMSTQGIYPNYCEQCGADMKR